MDFSLFALTIRLRVHLYDKLGRHQAASFILCLYLLQLICCFRGELSGKSKWKHHCTWSRSLSSQIFAPRQNACDTAQPTRPCIFPESQMQASICLIPSRLRSCGTEAGKHFPHSTPAWVSHATWVLSGRCPKGSEEHCSGGLCCQEVRHREPDKGKAMSSASLPRRPPFHQQVPHVVARGHWPYFSSALSLRWWPPGIQPTL